MPLEIRPGVTIRRPRREVAAVMFDHRYDDSWFETVRAIDPEATPDAAGSHERGIRFLLREIPVTLTLTDQAPERFIEYRTEDPFPLIVRLELESIPEGTLVRIRMRAETRGVLRLFKPLVRRRLRRSLLGDLEALKAIVENSPHRGMAAARPAEPTAATPPPAPVAPTPVTPDPPNPQARPVVEDVPRQPVWPAPKGPTPNW